MAKSVLNVGPYRGDPFKVPPNLFQKLDIQTMRQWILAIDYRDPENQNTIAKRTYSTSNLIYKLSRYITGV